jgi:CyaY protein
MDRIERAFEDIDPDQAECEQSLGSLTIRMGDGTKLILSGQPSVRQLWLAVAAKGLAFHFNYEQGPRAWLDDKGKGIELLDYLKKHFRESAGVELEFK